MVLRTFVHRDRDHVAGRIVLIGDVGVGDAEIGVAVLHVVAADRFLVGGEPIGIVDVGALEPRQDRKHRAGLHQVAQTVVRHRMVADEADFANSGLLALVDGEDEVDAAVGQLHQPLGHRGRIAAVLLVGLLDAADVGLRRRLVIGRVRLRLHFDFELVLLDVPVALEDDAIDDLRALAERDDDLAVDHPGADRGIDAGRLEVVDAALDGGRVRPGEVGLDGRGIDARATFDDDLLSESRRRRKQNAPKPRTTARTRALKKPRIQFMSLIVPHRAARRRPPAPRQPDPDKSPAVQPAASRLRRFARSVLSFPRARGRKRLTAFYSFRPLLQPFIRQDYTISRRRCREDTERWSTKR